MMARISILFFLLFSSAGAFAAGANETLYTILSASGFTAQVAGAVGTISVANVYCEEKTSSKKVKCTASQNGQMLNVVEAKLFLAALRGETLLSSFEFSPQKTIYTLTALTCSSRSVANGGSPYYSCTLTP